MNKRMQLNYRLHKLNTAQIIALGFAGVIFLGGILLWLPFCTAPGNHTSFTDAMFTGCHKCLRNRTCDSCDGDALDDDRKADRSDTDPDRGSGADFSGQYYFYKSA